jgi:hypothetical protein
MNIRLAKKDDINKLIEILNAFNNEFDCLQPVGGIEEKIISDRLLSIWEILKIWVCTDNDRILSALAMLEFLNPFSGQKAFEELFWYALPEVRGNKRCSLFDHMEKYALKKGVKYIAMSSINGVNSEKMKSFYLKKGFKLHQLQYFKQIQGGRK